MPIHDWTRVDAGIFHHFHQAWILEIAQALNAGVLPQDYYALAEQIAGGLGPDVLTLESPGGAGSRRKNHNGNAGEQREEGDGGVILATKPPRVRYTAECESERYAQRRSRIAIRHASDDRVVAVLEIVSPGNKASQHALRSFVDKALEFLDAGIHLLIIDLFPPTPRDPQGIHAAIWSELEETDFRLPEDEPLTLVAYASGETKKAFIEPTAVGKELVEMPLFFEARRYVPVPLAPTYDQAFAAVPQRWQAELG